MNERMKAEQLRKDTMELEREIVAMVGPIQCPGCGTEADFGIFDILSRDPRGCEGCDHVFDLDKIFGTDAVIEKISKFALDQKREREEEEGKT